MLLIASYRRRAFPFSTILNLLDAERLEVGVGGRTRVAKAVRHNPQGVQLERLTGLFDSFLIGLQREMTKSEPRCRIGDSKSSLLMSSRAFGRT